MPLQDWQGNWLKEVAALQMATTAQPDPPITSDLGQRVLLVRLASCCADIQGDTLEPSALADLATWTSAP